MDFFYMCVNVYLMLENCKKKKKTKKQKFVYLTKVVKDVCAY